MTNKEKFLKLYESIEREGAKDLLDRLETTDFFVAPASTRFHGAYEGGLVEHSVNVCIQLAKLVQFYNLSVTNETIAICSLLHDLCKVGMYKADTRNVKNENGQWEKVPCYTREEQFHFGGHGSKSLFLVQKYLKLTDEEAVAINCHMSCWDSDDYSVGDAFEQYPFAWALHVADEAATYLDEGKK